MAQHQEGQGSVPTPKAKSTGQRLYGLNASWLAIVGESTVAVRHVQHGDSTAIARELASGGCN